MEKQTRLKKFNGLPHSLQGLDYTYDAEVEGGEVSYTPKGSKDEFIFRKKSSNIKELEKQDNLRKNRPEGDRISDMSFDAVAKELMLGESQQLASEGIDPFNAGKDVFAIGGVNYDDPKPKVGIPEIVDTPKANNGYNTAGDVAGYASTAANIGTQFLAEDPYRDVKQPVATEVNVMQQTGDSVASAAGVPFYNETKAIAGLGTGLMNQGVEDDNKALEVTGSTIEGIDQFGSRMKSIDMADKGIITEEENAGIQALDFFIPFLGNNILNDKQNKYYEGQQKQAGYNESLAERGKLPQSNEVVRNRTQQFGNGGMKKKYAGTNGSVRNIDIYGNALIPTDPYEGIEPIDPSLGYPNINTDYLRGMLPPVTVNGNASNSSSSMTNAPQGSLLPVDSNYGLEPIDTSKINNNLSTADLLKKSMQGDKKKFDPNMLTSIVGGLGQMAPSLAYLFGDGKDYDKVKYPTYNPAKVTADLPLRETRDAFASAREAMRQQGKLDLGALSALATEESKGRSGVRENIANVNTGMMNDAQLKNIGFTIQAMNDEAANKGQYQTNKLQEQKNIAQAAALTARQYNMGSNDEIRKQLIASMVDQKFTELYPS